MVVLAEGAIFGHVRFVFFELVLQLLDLLFRYLIGSILSNALHDFGAAILQIMHCDA